MKKAVRTTRFAITTKQDLYRALDLFGEHCDYSDLEPTGYATTERDADGTLQLTMRVNWSQRKQSHCKLFLVPMKNAKR